MYAWLLVYTSVYTSVITISQVGSCIYATTLLHIKIMSNIYIYIHIGSPNEHVNLNRMDMKQICLRMMDMKKDMERKAMLFSSPKSACGEK